MNRICIIAETFFYSSLLKGKQRNKSFKIRTHVNLIISGLFCPNLSLSVIFILNRDTFLLKHYLDSTRLLHLFINFLMVIPACHLRHCVDQTDVHLFYLLNFFLIASRISRLLSCTYPLHFFFSLMALTQR